MAGNVYAYLCSIDELLDTKVEVLEQLSPA